MVPGQFPATGRGAYGSSAGLSGRRVGETGAEVVIWFCSCFWSLESDLGLAGTTETLSGVFEGSLDDLAFGISGCFERKALRTPLGCKCLVNFMVAWVWVRGR